VLHPCTNQYAQSASSRVSTLSFFLLCVALLLRTDSPRRFTTVDWQRSDTGIYPVATVTYVYLSVQGEAYAALYEPGGLYQSGANLSDWQPAKCRPPLLTPLSVIADHSHCLWLGTINGIYHSCDHTFRPVPHGPQGAIYDLAELGAQKIAAATEAGLFICSQHGCAATPVNSPTLAVSYNDGLLCAGTAYDGLWCTDDLDTWQLVPTTERKIVNSVSVDSLKRIFYTAFDVLYICNSRQEPCAPVDLPDGSQARLVLTQGRTLAVGSSDHAVLISTDGGHSWLKGSGFPSGTEITALAAGPAGLFLGGTNRDGLYLSTDGGHTWKRFLPGPGRTEVLALASSPSRTLYAGGDSGVYSSDDSGHSWHLLGKPLQRVQSLVVHEQSGSLLVGTAEGVYRCPARDQSWQLLTAELGCQSIFTLKVDPHNQDRIYAGSWGNNILRTLDGGRHWAPVHSGLQTLSVHSLAISPFTPDHLYAGTVEGVYCTRDRGKSWHFCSKGLPERSTIFCLLHSPSDACTVYAGTTRGLYATNECGARWQLLTPSHLPFTVNTCHLGPQGSSALVIGTEHFGVWASSDGGDTWQPWGLQDRSVYALMELPPHSILAATDDGIYTSNSWW